jgi:hypothetical protein
MRELIVGLDPAYLATPNVPELQLFANVIQDAIDLVQGAHSAKPADVAAARNWIRNGNVGVLTFNEACSWLGWDANRIRKAIFFGARIA